MDVCFNTPLKANRPSPASSPVSLRYVTPPRPEQPSMSGAGGGPSSPPPHQQSSPSFADRYIPDRASQDMSLSSFLLTSKENLIPLLAMCSRQSPNREASVASSTPADAVAVVASSAGGAGGSYRAGGGGGRHSPSSPYGSPFTRESHSRPREPSPLLGSPFSATVRRHASRARLHRGGGSSISPGRGGSVASSVSDAFAKLRLDSASPRRRGGFGIGGTRSVSMDSDGATLNEDGWDRTGGMGAAMTGTHSGLRGTGMEAVMTPMDVEPYTGKLARTLFSDTPQISVLGAASGGANPTYNSSSCFALAAGTAANATAGSEQDRFSSTLGVVYEANRARNFTSKFFRVIAQTPERILDAADMIDDFYMNLIDWSSSDVVGVALRNVVYLWNASTCSITQLPPRPDSDGDSGASALVSGLNWAPDGQHLAVGCKDGSVDVWDVEAQTVVRHWRQHMGRVGSLSWTCGGGLLASGSKDATIRIQDLRDRQPLVSVLRAHKGEVCGLKWSPGRVHLASGGNDNQLLIWDRRMFHSETGVSGSVWSESEEDKAAFKRSTSSATSPVSDSVRGLYGSRGAQPVLYLNQHAAAVKAIAWNPVQPSLLASGGGTDDKTLRFWNTATGDCTHVVDTQSQVCGVLWAHSGTELVTSHGFSMNQLTIWKYPSLRRVADLTGHTSRVLHLCMSPDGEVVVSAAGDETIRFWRCFPPADSNSRFNGGGAISMPSPPSPRPGSGAGTSPFPSHTAPTPGGGGGAGLGSPAALMLGGGSGTRWAAAAAAAANALSTATSPGSHLHHDPVYLSDELALR